MYKFITITFTIAIFLFSTITIQAKPVTATSVKNNFKETKYKRKITDTYYRTRYVKRLGRTYEQTFKVIEYSDGIREYSFVSSHLVQRSFFGKSHALTKKRFAHSGAFKSKNRFGKLKRSRFKRRYSRAFGNRGFRLRQY